METRTLGRTGWAVSEIARGTYHGFHQSGADRVRSIAAVSGAPPPSARSERAAGAEGGGMNAGSDLGKTAV